MAVCLVAVVGLLVAAGVVLGGVGGPDHPDEWDERVVDLAAFVASERGLTFEHPVTVEFLTEDEYSERVRVDEGDLGGDEREALLDGYAGLQALGLVPLDADVVEMAGDVADDGTLAFYDPAAERVTVRGTEMTTDMEVTLVHELVHVAQDQAFDLEDGLSDKDAQAAEAFRALVEGDALRIQFAYVRSLDPDTQDEYLESYQADYEESATALAEVPGAVQALAGAPYLLGQPLVDLVASGGGNDAVDDAFADPPRTGEHLFDPRAYVDGDEPVAVDDPDVPDDAEQVGEAAPLGAIALFVVLAQRLDPLEALTAADGWGGDMAAVYRDGDDTCLRANLVGDSATDTDEMADALRRWAAVGPSGAASVEATGDELALESCAADGPDAADAPAGTEGDVLDVLDALLVPATRNQFMAMAPSASDGGHVEAFAFGDCVVRRLPLDVLTSTSDGTNLSPEVGEQIAGALGECRAG